MTSSEDGSFSLSNPPRFVRAPSLFCPKHDFPERPPQVYPNSTPRWVVPLNTEGKWLLTNRSPGEHLPEPPPGINKTSTPRRARGCWRRGGQARRSGAFSPSPPKTMAQRPRPRECRGLGRDRAAAAVRGHRAAGTRFAAASPAPPAAGAG